MTSIWLFFRIAVSYKKGFFRPMSRGLGTSEIGFPFVSVFLFLYWTHILFRTIFQSSTSTFLFALARKGVKRVLQA